MKKLIIAYLQLNDYAKRAQLLKYLKLKGYDITERGLRLAIVSLTHKDGVCIASTKDGWHLIKNRKDLEVHVKYIKSYIKKLSKKVRNIERNYSRATAKLFTA